MKTRSLIFALLVAGGLNANAQTVNAYWNFGTAQDNSFSGSIGSTAETWVGSPTLFSTGSADILSTSNGAAFTAFDSVNYAAGATLAWNPGSTGNSFTVGLDMTGLENLNMRYDYRGTASVGFTTFSAIEYSLNGTDFFSTIASPMMTMDSTVRSIAASSLDFSSVSAIENQGSVLIRFSLGNVPSGNSFRIDNLQLAATTASVIPEPSAFAALAGLGVLGLAAVRRRRS